MASDYERKKKHILISKFLDKTFEKAYIVYL